MELDRLLRVLRYRNNNKIEEWKEQLSRINYYISSSPSIKKAKITMYEFSKVSTYGEAAKEYEELIAIHSRPRVFTKKWLANEIEMLKTLDDVKSVDVDGSRLIIDTNIKTFKYDGIRSCSRFQLVIRFYSEIVFAMPMVTDKEIYFEGCPHPHVYHSGRMCVGGSKNMIFNSFYSGSLYTGVLGLFDVLKFPNPGDSLKQPNNWPLVKEVKDGA